MLEISLATKRETGGGGGRTVSIAQIISITKVRPSRGHATVTSKTRDCDVAKRN